MYTAPLRIHLKKFKAFVIDNNYIRLLHNQFVVSQYLIIMENIEYVVSKYKSVYVLNLKMFPNYRTNVEVAKLCIYDFCFDVITSSFAVIQSVVYNCVLLQFKLNIQSFVLYVHYTKLQ